MIKILFICHGNICRSPMAEFIMMQMLADRGLTNQFEVSSAATSTEEIWRGKGNPVYPPARRELARHGIDCAGKTARQVTKADYDYYDYLLCAEEMNIRNLRYIIPSDPQHKIHRMLAYAKHPRDIDDPWYSGNFDTVYTDIVEACESLLAHLGY